jgi:hypothetical protein
MKCRNYLNYYLTENKWFNKFIPFEELLHRKNFFNQIKSEELDEPINFEIIVSYSGVTRICRVVGRRPNDFSKRYLRERIWFLFL